MQDGPAGLLGTSRGSKPPSDASMLPVPSPFFNAIPLVTSCLLQLLLTPGRANPDVWKSAFARVKITQGIARESRP